MLTRARATGFWGWSIHQTFSPSYLHVEHVHVAFLPSTRRRSSLASALFGTLARSLLFVEDSRTKQVVTGKERKYTLLGFLSSFSCIYLFLFFFDIS